MGCDVLNFEFSTRGVRDIGIVEPVLSYLELKYKLNIVREWILGDYVSAIKQYRPKVIVVSNAIGTMEHFEMVKYAAMSGIKVISFISEGDMVDVKENVEILFWGNNADKVMYEYANLQWSQKNIDLIHKYIVQSVSFNLVCTGGTGFDRYQFLPLKSKKDFLNQYGFTGRFNKIVGIAGFPFYFFLSDIYKKDGQWSNMHLDREACDIMASQKEPLRMMYKNLIEQNPDILFILKFHPAELMKELSEFYELDKYDNIISILKEEKIEDVINVSDLWLGFESTTCMEAWLLGKTTIIANPEKKHFVRSLISSGSPQYGDAETLTHIVREFFLHGTVPDFDSLASQRETVISSVIGHGDGLNHKRAGDYIYSVIDYPAKPIPINKDYVTAIEHKQSRRRFRSKVRQWLYKTPLILIPRVKQERDKDQWRKEEFSPRRREELAEMYRQALTLFYQHKHI